MFMRYLGRGIGHLEQFSTDNDGDEEPAIQSDDYEEIEKDFLVTETCQDEEDGGDDEEGKGDGDDNNNNNNNEDDEDEDTGTLY